jgi:L-rhamnose mutarotase
MKRCELNEYRMRKRPVWGSVITLTFTLKINDHSLDNSNKKNPKFTSYNNKNDKEKIKKNY